MVAHNQAMLLSDRRAMEKQAQHPQRLGMGKMGRKKMDMDSTPLHLDIEKEESPSVVVAPEQRLKRLVGHGKKKASKKQLQEVGKEALSLHKKEHSVLEEESSSDEDAKLQGGMLYRHLKSKYGDKHTKSFVKGFKEGEGGLSGGNMGIDPITGDSIVGRVANPPPSFKRNTVGMGKPDGRKARGQAISRLMKEKGMSLAEASRHIKEHGM